MPRAEVTPELIARLRAFADRGAPLGAVIVSKRAYRLSAVGIAEPALIIPVSGSKRVHVGSRSVACGVGRFVMVHQAVPIDVENIPDRRAPYRALAFSFPWRLVEVVRLLWPGRPRKDARPVSVGELHPLDRALTALLDLDHEQDAAQRDHALVGVLIALASAGHDGFMGASEPGLAARVRASIMADPGRPWASAHVERALHLSGATLRRQLAAEGTSLRAILREARLHCAVALLQTTRHSVKAVAAACGYRSVASFRRQFKARFGVSPSDVANG